MIGALALLAGVLVALGGAHALSLAWLLAAACAIACCALSGLWRHPWPRRIALLAVGTAARRWRDAALAVAARMPRQPHDSRLLLEGRVISVPARFGAELGFDAEVVIVDGRAARSRVRAAHGSYGVTRRSCVWVNAGAGWCAMRRSRETRNFVGPEPERARLSRRRAPAGEGAAGGAQCTPAARRLLDRRRARARVRAHRRNGRGSRCGRAARRARGGIHGPP